MKDCSNCKHHKQGTHPIAVTIPHTVEVLEGGLVRNSTCHDCLNGIGYLPYFEPKEDLDFTSPEFDCCSPEPDEMAERVHQEWSYEGLDVNPETPPKDTNPKDRIGATKAPLDLVPDTVKALASLAFLEGALKYGACNWRIAGVRASIYKAALERHLAKWWNGEWADPVTKVPHLASVIACAGIIADADLAGKLTDDRPPSVAMGKFLTEMEDNIAHLKVLFKDCDPKHFTIKDSLSV